jgi:hypothetical protein
MGPKHVGTTRHILDRWKGSQGGKKKSCTKLTEITTMWTYNVGDFVPNWTMHSYLCWTHVYSLLVMTSLIFLFVLSGRLLPWILYCTFWNVEGPVQPLRQAVIGCNGPSWKAQYSLTGCIRPSTFQKVQFSNSFFFIIYIFFNLKNIYIYKEGEK